MQNLTVIFFIRLEHFLHMDFYTKYDHFLNFNIFLNQSNIVILELNDQNNIDKVEFEENANPYI